MGFLEGHRARDLQVELDQAAAAAAAGPEVVEPDTFRGEGGHDLFDAAELLGGQAAVGQVGHGVHDQEGAGSQHDGGDQQAEEGIGGGAGGPGDPHEGQVGGGPVGPADHQEGQEGAGVDPEIGSIVDAVRSQGRAAAPGGGSSQVPAD